MMSWGAAYGFARRSAQRSARASAPAASAWACAGICSERPAIGLLSGFPASSASVPSSESLDADFAVIGSGFGGSVAALRLAEKGYRVVVLERGKRLGPSDFPVTNLDVRKYLW